MGLLGGGGGPAGGSLGGLFDQFRHGGNGVHVDSWVSMGQNWRIAPDELT
jgi:uncharacterized protein YidB (DUF937 family)